MIQTTPRPTSEAPLQVLQALADEYPRTYFHDFAPACPPWCRSTHEEGDPFERSYHWSVSSEVRVDDEMLASVSIVRDGDSAPTLRFDGLDATFLTLEQARAVMAVVADMMDCAEQSLDPRDRIRA